MPAPRVAYCIFCDDIRPEIGNKFSIMGVYGGDMIFPVPPPILLAKWGIVVWLISDIGDVPKKMSVSVSVPPEKTEITALEFEPIPPPEHQEDATKMNFRAILPMPPTQLTEAGFIEVVVKTDAETLRAGRLFVRFAQPAAAPVEEAPPIN